MLNKIANTFSRTPVIFLHLIKTEKVYYWETIKQWLAAMVTKMLNRKTTVDVVSHIYLICYNRNVIILFHAKAIGT